MAGQMSCSLSLSTSVIGDVLASQSCDPICCPSFLWSLSPIHPSLALPCPHPLALKAVCSPLTLSLPMVGQTMGAPVFIPKGDWKTILREKLPGLLSKRQGMSLGTAMLLVYHQHGDEIMSGKHQCVFERRYYRPVREHPAEWNCILLPEDPCYEVFYVLRGHLTGKWCGRDPLPGVERFEDLQMPHSVNAMDLLRETIAWTVSTHYNGGRRSKLKAYQFTLRLYRWNTATT